MLQCWGERETGKADDQQQLTIFALLNALIETSLSTKRSAYARTNHTTAAMLKEAVHHDKVLRLFEPPQAEDVVVAYVYNIERPMVCIGRYTSTYTYT